MHIEKSIEERWLQAEKNIWAMIEGRVDDFIDIKKNKRESLRYAMNGWNNVGFACLYNNGELVKEFSGAGQQYALIAIEKIVKKLILARGCQRKLQGIYNIFAYINTITCIQERECRISE